MARPGPSWYKTAMAWTVDRLAHPVVPLLLAIDEEDALVHVSLHASVGELMRFATRHDATLRVDRRASTDVRRQFQEYLAGERTDFDLELRPLGTAYQRRAWDALLDIPYGRTCSYGDQAAALGDTVARAIGHANARNPLPIVIPCHRVIGSTGDLTGFGGGVEVKRWLLELEARRTVPAWRPGDAPQEQLGLF